MSDLDSRELHAFKDALLEWSKLQQARHGTRIQPSLAKRRLLAYYDFKTELNRRYYLNVARFA